MYCTYAAVVIYAHPRESAQKMSNTLAQSYTAESITGNKTFGATQMTSEFIFVLSFAPHTTKLYCDVIWECDARKSGATPNEAQAHLERLMRPCAHQRQPLHRNMRDASRRMYFLENFVSV